MSQIEVWGTGKPLAGFTQDVVLTNARKLFPTTKAQHIARFIAGKRFIITRVNDAAGAQKLIEGLARSGIEADTAGPPPDVVPEDESAITDDLDEPIEEPVDELAAPIEPAPPAARKRWKPILAASTLVVFAAVAAFGIKRYRDQREDSATQALIEAQTHAKLSAKFQAEADAQKQAELDAARKAKADAEEAQRLQNKEAALAEINNAFAEGNYPSVIALSERFEQMYGPDPVVTHLDENATFTLKEGARRGNFAAILDAPIKGSVHYEALRQWALQVQERAKPVH